MGIQEDESLSTGQNVSGNETQSAEAKKQTNRRQPHLDSHSMGQKNYYVYCFMKLEFIVYKTEYNSKWGNLDKSEITKDLNHDQYINKRLEARYVQAKEKL